MGAVASIDVLHFEIGEGEVECQLDGVGQRGPMSAKGVW